MPLLALLPRILVPTPLASRPSQDAISRTPRARPLPEAALRLASGEGPPKAKEKKRGQAPAKPTKSPKPAPAKQDGASDWVLGPYGDLMSRAEYEALIKSQAES